MSADRECRYGSIWIHRKNPSIVYRCTGEATLQHPDPKWDMQPVVLYQRVIFDGNSWVRLKSEFLDGRFTEKTCQG